MPISIICSIDIGIACYPTPLLRGSIVLQRSDQLRGKAPWVSFSLCKLKSVSLWCIRFKSSCLNFDIFPKFSILLPKPQPFSAWVVSAFVCGWLFYCAEAFSSVSSQFRNFTKSGGLLHCDIFQLDILRFPKPVRQGVLGKLQFIIGIMKFWN